MSQSELEKSPFCGCAIAKRSLCTHFMKKFLLPAALILSVGLVRAQSSAQAIFNIVDSSIITDGQYIENLTGEVDNLHFAVHNIGTTRVGDSSYDVATGRFDEWQNEPGDFDVIQFSRNGECALTFKSQNGIVRLNNAKNLYAYDFHKYSKNGYFMEQQLSTTTKV